MLRILSLIIFVVVMTGCTAIDEKNIFQMARVKQNEIVKMKISHAGKTIELTDGTVLPLFLDPMAEAASALDAGNTKLSPTNGDYVIDLFTNPTVRPTRFYYNSEKQWLFFARGAKKSRPFKCEPLLQPLSNLFELHNFRATICEKEGLPKYFDLTGWLSQNKFYGLQGNQFTVWDTENGSTESLLKDVWSMILSPDHAKLAYTNQKGLNIFDLKELKSNTAVKAGKNLSEGSAIPACWSPDSNQLMYAVEHEWYSDFYILNVANNKSTPFVFKGVQNFLSTPVAWLKNGNILFIVSSAQSKEGNREYTSAGYRSDLMEADPEGNFRPVTQMEDYHYISLAGLTENEKEALVLIREKTGAERKTALVNLTGGDLEYLPWSDNAVSAGISPDGRFVAATAPLEQGRPGYRLKLLDRYSGQIILTFENQDYTAEKRFLWHPDSTKFLYLDKSLEDAANNKLRLVQILPE